MDQAQLFDPEHYLSLVGALPDQEIDLAQAALALALLDRPGISPGPYFHHLKRLVAEVGERHLHLLEGGAVDDVMTQLAALKHILYDSHGYTGDVRHYDDLQNASLICTIDRSLGLPVVLCILYIHVARAQGWHMDGLNIPGHFVCRIEKAGQRALFDPFDSCRLLEAPDLRFLVKKALGPQAELSASYYESAENREILLRLQNNIKSRQVELEDYDAALKTVERMRLFAPEEYRLFLDAGVLYARTGQPVAAIGMLERYVAQTPDPVERREAELFLRQLVDALN
ncbi:MAG: transglutaminase family protein [Alphaproteobacteria bacterium]|nr:transglutaminase family protein [Alphaproteobacteria bacterium]